MCFVSNILKSKQFSTKLVTLFLLLVVVDNQFATTKKNTQLNKKINIIIMVITTTTITIINKKEINWDKFLSSLLLLNDNIEKVVQFFDYFLRGQGILILYVDMGMVREREREKRSTLTQLEEINAQNLQ